MQLSVLEDISFDIDMASLASSLRVREGSSSMLALEHLVSEALSLAKPKAIYGLAPITSREHDLVIIDGRRFTSRVLSVNLDGLNRVFPYAATCGQELEIWGSSKSDMLQRFWADQIMELALHAARFAVDRDMKARYGDMEISSMNPGSLADWPLSEQRPLFDLLGDPSQSVGIRLTESMLMLPVKSVSGIAFHSERGFASCQLCPRDDCPSRRAPFDSSLRDKQYGSSGQHTEGAS